MNWVELLCDYIRIREEHTIALTMGKAQHVRYHTLISRHSRGSAKTSTEIERHIHSAHVFYLYRER